jgi:hypothetical protein
MVVAEPVLLNLPANSHSRDRRIMKSSSVTVQSQVIEIEEIFLMHLSYLCTNLVLVMADIDKHHSIYGMFLRNVLTIK